MFHFSLKLKYQSTEPRLIQMFINWDKVLNQPNAKRIYNIRFSLSSRNPMDPGRSARGAGHPQKAMDVDFMTLDDHGLSWIIWIINDYQ